MKVIPLQTSGNLAGCDLNTFAKDISKCAAVIMRLGMWRFSHAVYNNGILKVQSIGNWCIGVPMVCLKLYNLEGILRRKAHAKNVFFDPYIGRCWLLGVKRLSGNGLHFCIA